MCCYNICDVAKSMHDVLCTGIMWACHVDFSIFSQNDDERKEECNLCLLLDEEEYDQLYSSECSETEPFPCSIL